MHLISEKANFPIENRNLLGQRNRPRSRIRRWLFSAIAFLVVLAAIWHWRAPILQKYAEYWIVNESPIAADAIIVLGGGVRTRPFEAAKLFHAGFAPKILIAGVSPAPDERMGIALTETERSRRILLSNGIPESAIEIIGTEVVSTKEEADAAKEWVRKHRAKALLIPTELPHTRRTRWIFRKTMGWTHAKADSGIRVIAITPPKYSVRDWWQHEEAVIDFQNELIKLAYYRLKY